MKFILDRSLSDLGIESVVIGIAKNVNPHAELSLTFLKKKNFNFNNHFIDDYYI